MHGHVQPSNAAPNLLLYSLPPAERECLFPHLQSVGAPLLLEPKCCIDRLSPPIISEGGTPYDLRAGVTCSSLGRLEVQIP